MKMRTTLLINISFIYLFFFILYFLFFFEIIALFELPPKMSLVSSCDPSVISLIPSFLDLALVNLIVFSLVFLSLTF